MLCGVAVLLTGVPSPTSATQSSSESDRVVYLSATETESLRDELFSAIRNYERSRRLYAPARWFARGGVCDELIGRMCLRLGSGSDWWFPEEVPTRMLEELEELLAELRAGAAAAPDEPWILGNLIFYLGEAGAWPEAARLLDSCPPVELEWCRMLRGTALHALGEYPAAQALFDAALLEMELEDKLEWLAPEEVAGDELRDYLEGLAPQPRLAAIERWWSLSDPFFLVEGNDRRSEHLARRTVNRLRDGGPSAYRLRFGRDLAEVTLRFGWEAGWERIPAEIGTLAMDSDIIGHQHPWSLPHVAPDEAVLGLGETEWEDWNPQSRRLPRTGYAPAYAPNLLPAGELLRFPRGEETVLVGRIDMPEDTSWHSGHDHPPLWPADPFVGRPTVSGLFLADAQGQVVASDSIRYPIVLGVPPEEMQEQLPERGGMAVSAAAGEWLVSLEHWAPDELRGARTRTGVMVERNPPDLLTLSDLAVLSSGEEPATLEEALPRLRAPEVRAGEDLLVGWELFGLGSAAAEQISYRLELTRAEGGVIRRVAGWFGLGSSDPEAALEWREQGPGSPGPSFRAIALSLPADLPPGRYQLLLELNTAGREPVATEREVRVTVR